MKVAVCSTQSYDRQFLSKANHEAGHELVFFDSHLCYETLRHLRPLPFEAGSSLLMPGSTVLVIYH